MPAAQRNGDLNSAGAAVTSSRNVKVNSKSITINGDANSAGGVINSVPQSNVKCNGELLAVNGSKGTGHGIGIHAAGAWKTANGSSTVNAGGLPVNRTGDNDDCLHARVGGSDNVNVG